MPMTPGTRLGPYELVSPLGAGGMGVVYRAKDSRLGRDVAIKVLPQHLSSSADLRARFEREARTVSSLNHPHICTLFDVGRESDTDFLVMELVEGETLADRLARGALPIADVLKFGAQIADALERAHRAGVVHRDLKPGNVMLTRSGIKLMDFGLARATGMSGPASASGLTLGGLTQSPTVAQPLTAEGTLIGTFQYMSPEQLEGREADARSDLWALGCVLYEMMTGQRAFQGGSQASLISSIMKEEPAPVAGLAPLSPPGLDRLIRACLAKSPDDRLQTAHDLGLQLGWIAEGEEPANVSSAASARGRGRERTAWAVGALGLLVAAAVLWSSRAREQPVLRAIIPQPANALFLFFGDNAGPPVLSPDGRALAFTAVDAVAGARLWVRDLAALDARPIAGTENATYPFWSPDSRSLGFFANQKVKRVDLATGQVFAICDAQAGRGGSWNRRGQIVFAPDFQTPLQVVPAMGGTPADISRLDSTLHTTHRWPEFLPDGSHFLYVAADHRDVTGPHNAVWVGSLDGRGNHALLPAAADAHFVDGELLYVQDSVLMARPFDPGGLRFTGDARPLSERVQFDPTTWKANFGVSRTGLLAYQPTGGRQGSQIRLLDRTGRVLHDAGESGNHFALKFVAGAHRAVYASQLQPNGDLFVYDVDRDMTRRLTNSEADEDMPTPSPDGRLLACTQRTPALRGTPAANYVIQVMPLDGGAPARTLYRGARDAWPLDWSADGRRLLVGLGNFSTYTSDTLAVLDLDDPVHIRWIASPPGGILYASFSHDGRWVAYGTASYTDPEVFVEPVPGASGARPPAGAGRLQISSRGGGIPRWRGDDRELYYARPDGMVVAVPLAAGVPQPGPETALFRVILRPYFQSLDVNADGSRFLVNVLGSEGAAPVVLVSGWKQDLKQR